MARKPSNGERKSKPLGVVIDLKPGDGHAGYVTLGHTESRLEELSKLLDSFINSERMSRKDAERAQRKVTVV